MGVYLVLGLIVYVVIALLVAKLLTGWKAKLITLLIFVLIPTWDIPLGLWEFNQACKDESGQFIYKTIKLPDEYFLREGEYNMRTGRSADDGEINYMHVSKEYQLVIAKQTKDIGRFCRINKRESKIIDINSKEVLGEARGFTLVGCWLKNWAVKNFASPSVSKYCPPDSKPGQGINYYNIEKSIFIKSNP